jgi:hypothetical protein
VERGCFRSGRVTILFDTALCIHCLDATLCHFSVWGMFSKCNPIPISGVVILTSAAGGGSNRGKEREKKYATMFQGVMVCLSCRTCLKHSDADAVRFREIEIETGFSLLGQSFLFGS